MSSAGAAYDPESGLFSSGSGGAAARTRLFRRFLTRRSRWAAAGLVVTLVIVYVADATPSGLLGRYPLHPRPPAIGTEDIWDGENEVGGGVIDGSSPPPLPPPRVGGWWPFGGVKQPVHGDSHRHGDFIVDEYGDHFDADWDKGIAPMHPDLSLLPSASSLFSEVDISTYLRPPSYKPFPESQLREIISEPPNIRSPDTPARLDANAFSAEWTGPELWDAPRGVIKPVQWQGFKGPRSGWETEAQRQVREERRDAVKRGFVWAWQAYKDHAWGHDEVKPVSRQPSDPFNGWGASIVDTLDTLLILGFNDEYNLCRPHVNQINFHWMQGRDWSQGYQAPDSEADENGETWAIHRDKSTAMPVFETGIRYLGGLLGAYDVSGDTLLVQRAVDVANVLAKAFNTNSGLPAGRMDPGNEAGVFRLGTVSVAEVGSMTLELIRLSQATGDRKWFDLAQRATDFIEDKVVPRSKYPPLIPMWFQPDVAAKAPMMGGFTFGALADSYYEYLVKAYKLLGGSMLADQYRRLYEGSIDAARGIIFTEIDVVPDRHLFTIGKFDKGVLSVETEHLTCFAGAMLGLGAKLLDRPDDMVDAERFTQTCYWLSAATPSGLQPETSWFYHRDEPYILNVTSEGNVYHPPVKHSIDDNNKLPSMHKDSHGVFRFTDDDTPVEENSGRKGKEPLHYHEAVQGVIPGVKKVDARYINRPETIESVFYLYRLTGDRKWQEKGWKMFVSWMEASKVPGGISSINDVTVPKDRRKFGDNMESFMFAETFKYHFLLQSEPDVLSLDDYVLNTEAHPFLANPDMSPGSQGLWNPPQPGDVVAELGVRGQGTDAQKWMRHAILDPIHNPPPPKLAKGGGGMGGGHGLPNNKPKLPPTIVRVKVASEERQEDN